MDQNHLPHIAMQGRVDGTRCRKIWLDTIKKNSESRGMTFVEAQRAAQERNTRRTILKKSERAAATPGR